MTRFKLLSTAVAAALLVALSPSSQAVEVSGVKMDDAAKVAGQELSLNGAGLRMKAIFKVYVIGLYLPKKETSAEAVMASPGSRRITLVMMRDIASDEFGQSFMSGVNANSDKAEKGKVVNQLVRFGEIFDGIGSLKKGDVVNLDYTPDKGTALLVNGKAVGEPLPDLAFNNTLLRIWLGDKPVDSALKPLLLGKAGS